MNGRYIHPQLAVFHVVFTGAAPTLRTGTVALVSARYASLRVAMEGQHLSKDDRSFDDLRRRLTSTSRRRLLTTILAAVVGALASIAGFNDAEGRPERTPRPTRTPQTEPTARPTRTPRPDLAPRPTEAFNIVGAEFH